MILSIAFFGLCAIALVTATLLIHGEDREAAPGRMFDRLLMDRTARIAVLLIWWWLGWHFLAGQTL